MWSSLGFIFLILRLSFIFLIPKKLGDLKVLREHVYTGDISIDI